MDPDEDDYPGEDIHSQSFIGVLIAQLKMLSKNPMINNELEKTLDVFLTKLNESQEYLENGIFNVKFAEAGLFLQSAADVYGKKVDSLWDSTLQYQMQLCSYSRLSEANVEEASKVQQRMNRNRRKKALVQDADNSDFCFDGLNALVEKATDFMKGRCASISSQKSNQNTTHLSGSSSDTQQLNPLLFGGDGKRQDRSVCGFQLPLECSVRNVPTGEKLCNYSDLYLNCAVPYLKTSGMSGAANGKCSKIAVVNWKEDWLLQKYLRERNLSYKQFWEQKISSNLGTLKLANRLVADTNSSNFINQIRRLCSTDSVNDELQFIHESMTEYEKNDTVQAELLQQNVSKEMQLDTENSDQRTGNLKQGFERISNADSLFPDGTLDESTDTEAAPDNCDAGYLTQQSTADSGIFCSDNPSFETDCPEHIESLQRQLSDVVEELQHPSELLSIPHKCTDPVDNSSVSENVEEIGKNECVSSVLRSESLSVLDTVNKNGHSGVCDSDGNTTNAKNVSEPDASVKKVPPNSLLFPVMQETNLKPVETAVVESRNRKRKLLMEDDGDDYIDYTQKKRKRQLRFRWLKTITVELKQFERFYRKHYQPEFGEGCIEDDADDDSTSIVSTVNEDALDNEDNTVCNPVTEQCTDKILLNKCCDDRQMENEDPIKDVLDIAANPPSTPFEHDVNSINITESDDLITDVMLHSSSSRAVADRARRANCDALTVPSNTRNLEMESVERLRVVSEWKKFVEPKLQAAEESAMFDIHEYGSRIMDTIPLQEQLGFNKLVDGKPPSEVVRYFLASLQLANTYNVELVVPLQNELANDTLEIKLLSRERYHEHLGEYEAPSESMFREKLAHMQAKRMSMLQSTPKRRISNHKRQKLS